MHPFISSCRSKHAISKKIPSKVRFGFAFVWLAAECENGISIHACVVIHSGLEGGDAVPWMQQHAAIDDDRRRDEDIMMMMMMG
mmetsp:Transcript_8421/g.24284  ORF Transcript_8421/g.24284 Transcript_8421/m.24284 type:complete len:84 (+) Transcript_8421:85-336(+)